MLYTYRHGGITGKSEQIRWLIYYWQGLDAKHQEKVIFPFLLITAPQQLTFYFVCRVLLRSRPKMLWPLWKAEEVTPIKCGWSPATSLRTSLCSSTARWLCTREPSLNIRR